MLYVLPLGYWGRPCGLWIAVTCCTRCSHCDGLCCGRWRLGHQDDPRASKSQTLIQNHVLPMVIWLIHLIFFFFFWLLIRYPIWRYWLWNWKFSLIFKLIRHSICATDHHGWYFRSYTIYSHWNSWVNFLCCVLVLLLRCWVCLGATKGRHLLHRMTSVRRLRGGRWRRGVAAVATLVILKLRKFMLPNYGSSVIITLCWTLCRRDMYYLYLVSGQFVSGYSVRYDWKMILLLNIYLIFGDNFHQNTCVIFWVNPWENWVLVG